MSRAPTVHDLSLLRAYHATSWLVRIGDDVHTLRLGAAFTHAPHLPGAIVTAYNPASEQRAEDENASANEALRAALASAGGRIQLALARAPDESWDEPGFLVSGIRLRNLLDIGAIQQQNAIVWLGEDAIPVLIASRDGFCGARRGDLLPSP